MSFDSVKLLLNVIPEFFGSIFSNNAGPEAADPPSDDLESQALNKTGSAKRPQNATRVENCFIIVGCLYDTPEISKFASTAGKT